MAEEVHASTHGGRHLGKAFAQLRIGPQILRMIAMAADIRQIMRGDGQARTGKITKVDHITGSQASARLIGGAADAA